MADDHGFDMNVPPPAGMWYRVDGSEASIGMRLGSAEGWWKVGTLGGIFVIGSFIVAVANRGPHGTAAFAAIAIVAFVIAWTLWSVVVMTFGTVEVHLSEERVGTVLSVGPWRRCRAVSISEIDRVELRPHGRCFGLYVDPFPQAIIAMCRRDGEPALALWVSDHEVRRRYMLEVLNRLLEEHQPAA